MTPDRARVMPRVAVRRTTTALGSRFERVLPSWRQTLTRGLTVFIFHEITDEPSAFHRECGTYTSPKVFERQLDWIAERFKVIEPIALPQLGGIGAIPQNAALLTFDDAWAGIFGVGLPMLHDRGFAALLFLNTATVNGEPDLGAVRAYERARRAEDPVLTTIQLSANEGDRVATQVRERYGADARFLAYQGATATSEDVARAGDSEGVWFGSHLHHHWEVPSIAPDLYERELARNAEALAPYRNRVPAFATPNGYAGGRGADPFAAPLRQGIRVIFTGTGNQNVGVDSPVLDRLFLPTEPASPHEWWYATHRRRILGRRTS